MPETDGGANPPASVARFGGTPVGFTQGRMRTALGELPHAEFVVSTADVASADIDYLSDLKLELDGGVALDGAAVRATPGVDGVELEAREGLAMVEGLVGPLKALTPWHTEIVYAAAREAGLDDDHLNIQDFDQLPTETMEVIAPLSGIEVREQYRVGRTLLLARSQIEAAAYNLPTGDLLEEFRDAESFALVLSTAPTMYAAEGDGLAEMDSALAWLALRARYGFARLPDGRPHHFDRDQAHALPARAPVVAVRGLATGRCWIRRPPAGKLETALSIAEERRWALPEFPERLPAADRQALLAARRALEPGDLVQRVHAMWESFEFYVAGTKLDELFSEVDRQRLIDGIDSDLPEHQRARLEDLFKNMLNQPSLMKRLRAAFDEDGVPITRAEHKLLGRLRKVRSRTAHGAATKMPTEQELDWGCSLMSRALVHRIYRLQLEGA